MKEIWCPIYGSALTVELIKHKFAENGLDDSILNVVKPRQTIKKNCFEVEFIRVNHSIQGAFGLAIKTPVGMIVHTGDFKVDYTPVDGEMIDLARFSELGQKGVLLMLADSTNIEHPGFTISEREVGKNLNDMLQEAEGRVIVATFSSNIHRVQQLIHSAERHGRKVCFLGRSMINFSNLASEINEASV